MIAQSDRKKFWKEKEFVKKQTSAWTLEKIQKLIYKINNIELLSKKNNINSLFIVSDFILESAQVNNHQLPK